MSYNDPGSDTVSAKPFIIGGLIILLVLIAIIGGCNYASSFDAPRPGYSAVCQTGGPIEGDSGTCGVLSSGSGKRNIGFQNNLIEFPAQQRFYRLAAEGAGGDAKEIILPTSNGVNVSIDGQARFTLNQDEKVLLDFYKKYGTRSYGGPKPADDPDRWWETFLAAQFNPLLEATLREEVGKYTCAELNPSCDLTKLNADLDKLAAQQEKGDNAQGREANQKLATIATAVTDSLNASLEAELGGKFFRGLTFKLNKVQPPGDLLAEINGANAALARIVKERADAKANAEKAIGIANAKREEAKGIEALNSAYANAPEKAEIDKWKAICGEQGCPIDTLAGDMTLMKGK